MPKHRFFLPRDFFTPTCARLPTSIQSRITNVLRLKKGDAIDVLDGSGAIYHARLARSKNGELIAEIVGSEITESEPKTRITLLIALTQREKFEQILQKGTEIGVHAFQPFTSARTLIQQSNLLAKKYNRWEEIIREATEQSGRGRLPILKPAQPLKACLEECAAAGELLLAAWADPTLPDLKSVLANLPNKRSPIGLIIGPEGGFSAEELAHMRTSGIQPFQLGRRILRMETAAILAPAMVLYEMGDMRALE